MKEIEIINVKEELRIDSRLLAPLFDHRHRNIIANIDKYGHKLLELGALPFETSMGINGGVPVRYFLLNDDQCVFLTMLMRNSDKIVDAKLAITKAFSDARAQLAKRDIARIDGKQVRKLEVEAINDLVGYAKLNGSKNADKYFMNITKMVNKIIGIESGQRDKLDEKTLSRIALAEKVVQIGISDGMSAGLDYKDIYKLCKNRVELTVDSKLMIK